MLTSAMLVELMSKAFNFEMRMSIEPNVVLKTVRTLIETLCEAHVVPCF